MKSNPIKRALTVALAVMMVAGVSVTSVFAVGWDPAPPYFFLDEDLTTTPNMGNATINDVEYSGDSFYLFLQPETYTNPYNEHVYIGIIDEFGVYDSSGKLIDVMTGGAVATIPGTATYVRYNDNGDPYYAVHIGVEMYDTTAGEPAPHLSYDVFLSIDAIEK
jgi:hypothetical protein